jgi:hypothetical protein
MDCSLPALRASRLNTDRKSRTLLEAGLLACGLGAVPPERRIVGDVSVKLWTHIPQRPRGDKARE